MLAEPSVWRGAFTAARPRNVWSDPGAVQLAEQILVRFARVARERGAQPVILQLPLHSEMAEYLERGKEPLASVETRAICERNGPRTASSRCSTSGPEPMGERWSYFVRGKGGGHYSASRQSLDRRQRWPTGCARSRPTW